MEFRTLVPMRQIENRIGYDSVVFSMGSCFSVNMADKLKYYKFQSQVNPFGIIFNPLAINKILQLSVENYTFTEVDTVENMGVWSCLDVHSQLNALSQSELLDKLNNSLKEFRGYLEKASYILITFGTAWVYRYIDTNQRVANCHKLPHKLFRKELLSFQEIIETYKGITDLLLKHKPDIQLIYSISPVRHLKDGILENQRSKSLLISALHEFIQEENIDGVNYFPAYEIMMDELRDYRFYDIDMLHPSKLAIDYIWDRFKSVWIESEAIKTMNEVEYIQRGLRHEFFNENSEQTKIFKANLQSRISSLKMSFPFMDFDCP